MATTLTCIICPNGCQLTVDDDLNVTGNKCLRGVEYGKQEVTDPRRTVTSTVKIASKQLRVCPVKTNVAIPKNMIFKVMEIVNQTSIVPPVYIGDVIVKDIAGTGADLVSTREVLD